MSAVDDILADIRIDQLAGQLGVDEATAEAATRQAIPALLGGMQANAQNPGGAASLAGKAAICGRNSDMCARAHTSYFLCFQLLSALRDTAA